MIPKKLYVRELDIDIFNEEAEATRSWAANRPNTGRREYTDLSQVWHEAKEEPESGRQVIAIKDNTAFCGIYRPYDNKGYTPRYQGLYWSGDGCLAGSIWVYWKDVVKWAYIDDMLPKGGE